MRVQIAAILFSALVLAGCQEDKTVQAPPPAQEVTADAVGHYCGMSLPDHEGPKGQILLKSKKEPVWFSSIRDTFAFTMLPEEPKDIAAIYVNDMGKAKNWRQPESGTWVEARQAWFVLGSRYTGGMGDGEAVPFADKAAADAFAGRNGGKVARFAEVPRSYIFGERDDHSPGHGEAKATPANDGHAHN